MTAIMYVEVPHVGIEAPTKDMVKTRPSSEVLKPRTFSSDLAAALRKTKPVKRKTTLKGR